MIKNIRIRNFKSLRDVSVDLEPVTVLVGRGGTGKTNFVDAIAFLRDCLLGKQKAFEKWGDWHAIMCATSGYNLEDKKWPPIEFDVRFDVPGKNGEFAYHLGIDSVPNDSTTDMQFGEESLVYDNLTLFSRRNDDWIRTPAVVPLPRPAPIALELASGVPEIGLAYTFLSGIGRYDFLGDILRTGKNGHANPNGAGLADDGANFLECLEAISRNQQKVSVQQEMVAALRKLKPALRGLQIALPAKDRAIVSLRAERTNIDVLFDLSQESEGFRRFLAHLIALNQVPQKALMIFEEPEKGMYAGALSALADQIKAFPERSGGQIILTTHSPVLLDSFAPEQIRVVEMENLETKIGPVSEPQMEALREQLETTGELLTVDPARLA